MTLKNLFQNLPFKLIWTSKKPIKGHHVIPNFFNENSVLPQNMDIVMNLQLYSNKHTIDGKNKKQFYTLNS